MSTILPDYTGNTVNLALQLVLDQSVPTVRKLAFLSLSISHVCSSTTARCFKNQTIFCFAWNLRDDCSLCLSNPRRLLFPTHRYFVLYFRTSSPSWEFLDLSLNNYDARLLDFKGILILTSLLNGLIFIVNLVTGGDYGFMTKPPLVGDHGLVVNYIIVTLFLTCAIFLFSKGFQVITQEKAERRLKIWQK